MPLFATFLGSLATALANLYALFMGYRLALKFAAYTAWALIFGALLTSVFVCINSIYTMVASLISGGGGGGGWLAGFFMGVGMFIPANAGAVISCIGSVWIATSIYKFQRDAIIHFGS